MKNIKLMMFFGFGIMVGTANMLNAFGRYDSVPREWGYTHVSIDDTGGDNIPNYVDMLPGNSEKPDCHANSVMVNGEYTGCEITARDGRVEFSNKAQISEYGCRTTCRTHSILNK